MTDLSNDKVQDSDDEVFVPYDFQVDGRKREAKRLKSRTKVPQEEIDIEHLVKEYQNSNKKIIDLEQELSNLKNQALSKRELQS
jgi:predicted RNase H-like nuclease (RuvC/YqgF family)